MREGPGEVETVDIHCVPRSRTIPRFDLDSRDLGIAARGTIDAGDWNSILGRGVSHRVRLRAS
jgi:hypothetical protein